MNLKLSKCKEPWQNVLALMKKSIMTAEFKPHHYQILLCWMNSCENTYKKFEKCFNSLAMNKKHISFTCVIYRDCLNVLMDILRIM